MKIDYREKALIVDVDGTTANVNHRRRNKPDGKFDWKYFNDPMNMTGDTPNDWCRDLVKGMFHTGYRIIFVTGRFEKNRYLTFEWFKHYGVPAGFLFMRKDEDFRKDFVVKKELYEKFIKPKYNIKFVIDDRQQVVDMWRSIGLTCLQCAKGDF